jgi:hypothetical protein
MDPRDNDTDAATSGVAPDQASGPDRAARPWLEAIKDAKAYFQFWQDKCDNIDKLYADLKSMANDGVDREFQMFWANLEILKPSIYSRPPIPVVVPRFKDRKPVPREASEMLERSLIVNFEAKDVNSVMLQVRDDAVTSARGAAWVRYENYEDEQGERVCFDHVDRSDFLHEPSRKWQEVGWVAKRAWLARDQGLQRFGDIFLRVNLKSRKELTGETESPDYAGEKKGEVWELWSKTKKLVVWVAEGLEEVLDIQPPFLQLENFYPCPRPVYTTTERRKLIPVPDFVYYKDQLEEINELTARISALSEALRMKGFYPAGSGDLAEAVETAIKQRDQNAILVPVANFAALGGTALKDSIIWLPVVEIATTIKELVLLRRQLIDDVYQITGLSDIMRGATDPDETAAAQELKSQYGSIRIRDRQAEMVRFARDLTRIAGEIMAENFSPETLMAMSQMDLPTDQDIQGRIQQITQQARQMAADPQVQMMAQDPQGMQQLEQLKQQAEQQIAQLEQTVTVDKCVALLREQRLRPFILEIETDSTIQPDENAEKEKRAEFLTALGGTLQQLVPLVQMMPASAPFATAILKFAVAPFRAGKELDQAIEQFGEAVTAQAQQTMQQPPPPDPNMAKVELDKQRFEQIELPAAQKDMALKDAELQGKTAEHEGRAAEQQSKAASQALDTEGKTLDLNMKRKQLDHADRDMRLKEESHRRDGENKRKELDLKAKGKDGGTKVQVGGSDEDGLKALGEVMGKAIMQSQQQTAQLIAEGNKQVVAAITAPKTVTTPDGRTYTAHTGRVN